MERLTRGEFSREATPRTARMAAYLSPAVALLALAGAVSCTGTATGELPEEQAQASVRDPGARAVPPGAAIGEPLPDLAADETAAFQAGLAQFNEVQDVQTPTGQGAGLGPRYNSTSCARCHAHPAVGGTSPLANPQVADAAASGATNTVPWFVTLNGPVREARFKRGPSGAPDGSVHALFTITGRSDAAGCSIEQPSFTPAGDPLTGQGGNSNIVFRIPTPLFGAGLIEAIPDMAIVMNMAADAVQKSQLGIFGHPNTNGNDGTITRFGWKAQNKSLSIFSGEAYNVEMGVTNELFPQERDETPGCLFNALPEDAFDTTAADPLEAASDAQKFVFFMRFLAPPTPAPDTPSIANGRALFRTTGCAFCHSPTLQTGKAASHAASNQPVNLFSDLLVHRMGRRLADGITQGDAGQDEFRTAPLWGVGQRIFLLHDGRTTSMIDAIEAHRSRGSEATAVIERFNRLRGREQQDIVNFLRSL
jgi:CxxC motif-containing protein (DUF1111 family)